MGETGKQAGMRREEVEVELLAVKVWLWKCRSSDRGGLKGPLILVCVSVALCVLIPLINWRIASCRDRPDPFPCRWEPPREREKSVYVLPQFRLGERD